MAVTQDGDSAKKVNEADDYSFLMMGSVMFFSIQKFLFQKTINFRDVFVAPSSDEVDAAVMNTKGEPRMLTKKQQRSIRDWG